MWIKEWRSCGRPRPQVFKPRSLMPVTRQHTIPIQTDPDIVRSRQIVRQWAQELQFSLVDQTKLVTAASELARNTVIYGRGGTMRLEVLSENPRTGLRVVFEDHGPG